MVTVVLICALGVALLLAVAGAAAAWRLRDQADRRVAEAVGKVASGMQETLRDLAQAAESTPIGVPAPERFAGELAASLDLDEVTERTLEAAGAVPGVEAAHLETGGPEGRRIEATVGMQPDEAAKARLGVPDNDNLRAVEVTYRYRIDDVDSSAPVVRSGVVVPLRAEGIPTGSLSAFTRSSTRRLADSEIDELERLAYRAGPALENARRSRHLPTTICAR